MKKQFFSIFSVAFLLIGFITTPALSQYTLINVTGKVVKSDGTSDWSKAINPTVVCNGTEIGVDANGNFSGKCVVGLNKKIQVRAFIIEQTTFYRKKWIGSVVAPSGLPITLKMRRRR